MEWVNFAKTANRSVVGSMNDLAFLAEHYLADGFPHYLLGLSLRIAGTPCGPLRSGMASRSGSSWHSLMS